MLRIRSTWSIVAVLTLALGAFLGAQVMEVRDQRAQQPTERRIPVGTSSISGTVVSSATGRPIPAAHVNVNGSGLSRSVTTDANGQFCFPRLPAGDFSISVYQNYFLQTNYGQKRQNGEGKQIQLAEGQQMTLKIPMQRGGVLTGMVFGPDGEPQRNAQVRGWRFDTSSGFRHLQGQGYAQTDDRGVYRMYGLQPGDWVVSATPNPDSYGDQGDSLAVERAIASGRVLAPASAGRTPTVSVPIRQQSMSDHMMMAPAYLPTYAPSSLVASGATMLTIAGDEERTGVDVRVQLIQASNIQGAVSTPLETGVLLQVALVSDDPTIDGAQPNQARTDATGAFWFRGIAPGSYTLLAQTVAGPAPVTYVNGQSVGPQQPQPVLTDAQKLCAKTHITVSGEVLIPVSISLQPARSISGVVVFETAKPPDLSKARFTVTLNMPPSPQQMYFFGGQPQAQVGPDGRFTITGVPPGRFVIRVNGGRTQSAIVAGQDTLDFPLEFTGDRDVTDAVVTITDQTSELSGTLTDSGGKPAPDYFIIVAASDSRYWCPESRRVVVERPEPNGRYSFHGLPPGAYQIAAVVDLEDGAQYNPDFLRAISRASVPVTIMGTGKVTQDLRVR